MTVYHVSTMRLEDGVNGIVGALNRGHTLDAMRNVDAVNRELLKIATALVEAGVKEGLTQAEMARALGVPASTLRGAKREFAR